MITETKVISPCNNICRLDINKICIGCKRTLDEIANWSSYSDFQKQNVIERIKYEQRTK